MKLVILMVVVAALAAPVAAIADGAPTPSSTANQICKLAQSQLTPALFASTYGTFGKCVSKLAQG